MPSSSAKASNSNATSTTAEAAAVEKEKAKVFLTKQEQKTREMYMAQVATRKDEQAKQERNISRLLEKVKLNPKEYEHNEVYGKISELDPETIQRIAQKEIIPLSEQDVVGHYHLHRFKKTKHPIPGTQLRIERERELIHQAKLALLNSNEVLNVSLQVLASKGTKEISSDQDRLGFKMGKIADLLSSQTEELETDLNFRKVRLAQPDCSFQELQEFWTYLQSGKSNLVKQMIIDGTFRDINVAVTRDEKGQILSARNASRDLAITPLMLACRKLQVDVVETLLLYDAEPRLGTANGDTAVHFLFKDWPYAKLNAHRPSITYAIRKQKTMRILTLAIEKWQTLRHAGEKIIQFGNTFGETPLHYCAKIGFREAVVYLMDHGADPFARDVRGNSPADLAQTHFHEDLYRIMINHGVVSKTKQVERQRQADHFLLNTKPGALSQTWSPSAHEALKVLKNQTRQAGHARGRFLTPGGQVIVQQDEDFVKMMRTL